MQEERVVKISRYSFINYRGGVELKLSAVIIDTLIAVGVIIALWMTLMPRYNVWSRHMAGEAILAQASQDRQVKVQEALATKDSAQLLADAEAIRASGVARANQIIGDSLKGNEAYLRYLWIDSLDKTKGQVIYIPTEANLPVLESQRLNPNVSVK